MERITDLAIFSVAGFMTGSLTFSMKMSVHAVGISVMMTWILSAAYRVDTPALCLRALFIAGHFIGILRKDFHGGDVRPIYMIVFVFAVFNVSSLFFLMRALKRREPAATELENEEA